MADMENNFLEGNGIIILLLFFLMFGWNGGMGGYGGYGGFGSAAAQGALTRAELADGFNMNEVQRNQSDIKQAICATNQNILENRYAIGNQVLENRYQAALQAQNAQAQMASCCCDLRTAIHAEGEATRDLIQQNVMQELRDNLQAAQLQLGNVAQTQNILNSLGRFYTNPPVNPYTCYNGNGYGFGCGCGCA